MARPGKRIRTRRLGAKCRFSKTLKWEPRMSVGERRELLRGGACAVVGMIIAASGVASCAGAQGYPFSQRGMVSQMIAFTNIGIEYGRPTARGRALFGALVPWDSVWHPGADSATQITIAHDITLEDQPVKAGTYTVWLVPHEQDRKSVV